VVAAACSLRDRDESGSLSQPHLTRYLCSLPLVCRIGRSRLPPPHWALAALPGACAGIASILTAFVPFPAPHCCGAHAQLRTSAVRSSIFSTTLHSALDFRAGASLLTHSTQKCTSATMAASGASGGASAVERTFWVKLGDDLRFVKLRSSAADVDDLIREIAKELDVTARLGTITAHVARDREGRDLGAALESTDSVKDALPEADKIRIVIKVAAPATGGE